MRKLQAIAPKGRPHLINCFTDSLMDPAGAMGPEWTRGTEQLRRILENQGCNVRVANLGRAGARSDDGGTGDSTTPTGSSIQLLHRYNPFVPSYAIAPGQPSVPADISVIEIGTNDIKSPSACSVSGTTATATVTSHGFSTGTIADTYGGSPSGLNITGSATNYLTAVDANTLSWTVPGGTGTPTVFPTIRLQTQRNIRALIKALRFGVRPHPLYFGCSYRSQANLPVDGVPGDRFVVLYDTSTTGGVAAYSDEQMATITGSAAAGDPTVWEFRHNKAGESGWGRIAVAGTAPDLVRGCLRIIVVSQPYLNYSANGDTQSTPYALYDSVTGMRSQQIAAVNAENTSVTMGGVTWNSVVYGDLYSYHSARIAGGLDTQGDHLWHVLDQNIHNSEYGHYLRAQHLYATIKAQTGWLAALSS